MKAIRVGLVGLLLLAPRPVATQVTYPFQDSALPMEQRISSILALMTLAEKIAALGTSTAVPRLHIREFSQVVGLGQTWDKNLVRKAGGVQGAEARWLYNASGTLKRNALVVWGPNTDLARDPRWGRIDESYGEDAFLTGTLASAFTRGMQGDDPKYWRAAALLKHFFANSNEHGRYGSSSDFDVRLMREYYSVPFRMAFVDGGARSYMAAYNAWNRVPMIVHPILRDVVAHDWGIDGILSTDAGAVSNMVRKHKYFE